MSYQGVVISKTLRQHAIKPKIDQLRVAAEVIATTFKFHLVLKSLFVFVSKPKVDQLHAAAN